MKKLAITLLLLITSCSWFGGDDPPEPQVPDSFGCMSLVELPPRGLSTLHCNVGAARNQCQVLGDILGRSCIDKPALNYLVDGTFGFDLPGMNHDVYRLTERGRKPHVEFYLMSGPTQRRCHSQTYGGWETKTCPEEFRNKIKYNPQTQEEYRNLYRRLTPLIDNIFSWGGSVSVAIALEDNLDDASASKMIELLRGVMDPRVKLVRNPCPNCYQGNQAWIPPGVAEEVHKCDPNHFNIISGVVSNDGSSFGFSGDGEPCPLTLLKSTRNKAGELGNWFFAWSAKYQGLKTGGTLPPPSGRDYKTPTPPEQQTLVEFLSE